MQKSLVELGNSGPGGLRHVTHHNKKCDPFRLNRFESRRFSAWGSHRHELVATAPFPWVKFTDHWGRVRSSTHRFYPTRAFECTTRVVSTATDVHKSVARRKRVVKTKICWAGSNF